VREIEPYRAFVSSSFPKAVRVVVSGAGDREVIASGSGRLLFFDGRPGDLEKPRDPSISWVSDNWANHFTWKGKGGFPHEERMKLREMVFKSQERGYRLRFWATPEEPAVWEELARARVDLIGTDRLADLGRYLRKSGLY
jgi:Glycerophosphoryl diester phosphodiesterase family